MQPPIKFQWRGIHHGYTGIFFVTFGTFFLYMNSGNSLDGVNIIYKIFIGVGSFLILDDIVEHKITANTPLRIIYEKFILKYIKREN